MPELSTRSVGYLIAFIIPGFILLWGLSFVSEDARALLLGSGEAGPSLASFLVVLVTSLGAGMTASAFRWAIIDTVFGFAGLKRPVVNDALLSDKLAGAEHLIEQHYRYFQFYANSIIAGVTAFCLWRSSPHGLEVPFGGPELVLLVTVGVFAAGASDSLRNYYRRLVLLLGEAKGEGQMTNGAHPENDGQKGKTSSQQAKGKGSTATAPAKQTPTAAAGNKPK